MIAGLEIALMHEVDEPNGCEFGDVMAHTPADLIDRGLFNKLATPLHSGLHRAVSLLLAAKAMGATAEGRKKLVEQARTSAARLPSRSASSARGLTCGHPRRGGTLRSRSWWSRHLRAVPTRIWMRASRHRRLRSTPPRWFENRPDSSGSARMSDPQILISTLSLTLIAATRTHPRTSWIEHWARSSYLAAVEQQNARRRSGGVG